jgi:hypothetical protein
MAEPEREGDHPNGAAPEAVTLVNLCPHDVVIVAADGKLVIPPEVSPARCAVERMQVGEVSCDGRMIPVVESRVTEPPELPAYRDQVLLIVSRMVAEAATGRDDLVFPDGLVRDSTGAVIGCTALARLA